MSRDPGPAGTSRWAPRLAWLLWGLTMSALAAAIWVDLLLRRAARPELALRAHELLYVVALVGMATVGAVLAGRRPRHPVGWLMLALGLSVIVDGVTDGYARYGLLASPGSVPAVRHIRPLGDTFVLWPACIGFILLLTPTGSLPSQRWRWWAASPWSLRCHGRRRPSSGSQRWSSRPSTRSRTRTSSPPWRPRP